MFIKKRYISFYTFYTNNEFKIEKRIIYVLYGGRLIKLPLSSLKCICILKIPALVLTEYLPALHYICAFELLILLLMS